MFFNQVDDKGSLDLSIWKRCIVTSIEKDGHEIVLTVCEENTTNEAKCRLQGAWYVSRFTGIKQQ